MMQLPAALVANNLDPNALRTNATLPQDAWIQTDTAVAEVFAKRLVGLADLRDRGLTVQLGGLGSMISLWHQSSDMDPAEVSMLASKDALQDRVLYEPVEVPIPCIFKEFQIDLRVLEASRRMGDAVDTLQARVAARKVAEACESMLFLGNTTVYGGKPIYGYLTHPARNTTTGADWATPANVHANLTDALTKMDSDNQEPPYVLYVSPVQFRQLSTYINTTSDATAYTAALANFPEVSSIKRCPSIPDGQAVLVAMNAETVDLAVGVDAMVVEWMSFGGLLGHFRVLTAAAPRVKSDYDGRCGIVHISGI